MGRIVKKALKEELVKDRVIMVFDCVGGIVDVCISDYCLKNKKSSYVKNDSN